MSDTRSLRWMKWWPWPKGEGLPLSLGDTHARGMGAGAGQHGFDQTLVWVVLGIMAWGLVMV